MKDKYYIGWCRGGRGGKYGWITARPRKEIANTITTFTGGGIPDAFDGLSGTSPHIVYEYG